MSLTSWIENTVNENYCLDDTTLIRLKDSVSQLHSVLNDIYSSGSAKKSRNNYRSINGFELLINKVRFEHPDEFYCFKSLNVTISIVLVHDNYYIMSDNYDFDLMSLQTVVQSSVFKQINLFTDLDSSLFSVNEFTKLKDNYTCTAKFLGPFSRSQFDDMVFVYHKLCEMCLSEIGII